MIPSPRSSYVSEQTRPAVAAGGGDQEKPKKADTTQRLPPGSFRRLAMSGAAAPVAEDHEQRNQQYPAISRILACVQLGCRRRAWLLRAPRGRLTPYRRAGSPGRSTARPRADGAPARAYQNSTVGWPVRQALPAASNPNGTLLTVNSGTARRPGDHHAMRIAVPAVMPIG